MIASRPPFSLGAAALVLCLALPMGVLSLLAPPTASDQLAAADAVVLARVSAVQTGSNPWSGSESPTSHVALLVEQRLVGAKVPLMQRFELPGRTALQAGDLVLALIDSAERELLGTYLVEKRGVEHVVLEGIDGFQTEGLPATGGQPLASVVQAFKIRLGELDPADVAGGDADDEELAEGTAGDALEPNNDLASASPIFLNPAVPVTGLNPLFVTGLSITPGDVDFFSFSAPGPTLLHAETRLPEGATSLGLDTLIGFFDGTTGELVAFDDDGGAGKLSRLVAPVERLGNMPASYALAVESAPDPDLDFTGADGVTTGLYELLVELETAKYIGNATDQVVGVSPDGTFIEDLVGYREVFGEDVLLDGVPGDGWGLAYDVTIPSGLTTIFGGFGDFLVPPDFGHDARLLSFDFGAFTDENGTNRTGKAESAVLLPYLPAPGNGARITHTYVVGLNQTVVGGAVGLQFSGPRRIEDLDFERLLDVDLFGGEGDTFFWSFPANGRVKAFAVPSDAKVGELEAPMETNGSAEGDLQAALTAGLLPGEQLPGNGKKLFRLAFTLVTDFVSMDDAVQSAAQNLIAGDAQAWVIAVDDDPETGLYTAFGAAIGDPRP